ncbi:hypothetical protein ACFL13_01405 [Patescibacteria group bacterium]
MNEKEARAIIGDLAKRFAKSGEKVNISDFQSSSDGSYWKANLRKVINDCEITALAIACRRYGAVLILNA